MLAFVGHIRIRHVVHNRLPIRVERNASKLSNGILRLRIKGKSHVHQIQRRSFLQCVPRRAKKSTVVNLDDLPQGVLPDGDLAVEDELPSYPTVVLQARMNMRKFDNCVLLTRVGGFYELYFEHAEEFGPLLNLKVAQKKTNAGPVPMAGFPFFQLDRFLKILVQDLNRYVAIAEEFPNNASEKVRAGGLLHDRKVSRVITPGTLIDENFLDPYAHNYVLALHVDQITLKDEPSILRASPEELSGLSMKDSSPIGLAWLDLSTGTFVTQSANLSMLPSILSRISPREIVLDQSLEHSVNEALLSFLQQERYLVTFCPTVEIKPIKNWTPMLESEISSINASEFTAEEVIAGSMLLQYVETRLQGQSLQLQPPRRYQVEEVMGIDRNSLKALEIRQTIRDGFTNGSLLNTIRRTVTKGGARLLSDWLGAPSTSLSVINKRLDLVTHMLDQGLLRERVINLLRRCHDSQRLVQKFALGRGDADDLLALANTILATNELVSLLQDQNVVGDTTQAADGATSVEDLLLRIHVDDPLTLASRIKNAIDEEGLMKQHRLEEGEAEKMKSLARDVESAAGGAEDDVPEPRTPLRPKPTSLREHYLESSDVWIMKAKASRRLKQLHDGLEQLHVEKSALTKALQIKYEAPSLTLRWTPGLGHICHVKGRDTQNLKEIRSVNSSRSTRSFHESEWSQLGQRIDLAKIEIRTEEQRIFKSLRKQVILNLTKLRDNAAALDELDVSCSFATLAGEQGLVRPILNNGCVHKIMGGQHPTVRSGLREQGQSFTSNDCFVGKPERVWLITGPNMAGKSTFLRQNALITIMAQVGSYVPADYAEIGIVDQIFSRVGSADDLYRNRSTFMVEMLETALILRNASPRSFVIMDEIGRGTKPEDGVAIAFACLHHLYHINQCRTLFATHFHELADLAREMDEVGFYCTDIMEEDGKFSYVHKLRKGINRESHALKVAMLAGVPEAAIEVAERILQEKSSV